jgi:hypothetical protein
LGHANGKTAERVRGVAGPVKSQSWHNVAGTPARSTVLAAL